jgi:hypothetical protein
VGELKIEMNRDRLTPQQIGKVFFEVLKLEAKIINTTMEDIMTLVEQPKPKVDLKHIKDELIYLNIYIIYQAIFSRFKSSFDEIEFCLKEELKRFIEEQISKESVLQIIINVNNALIGYMEQHNNTIARDANGSNGLVKFSHYISTRVLGEEAGDDIRYVMYMSSYYVSRLTGLVKVIDNAIELISRNQR